MYASSDDEDRDDYGMLDEFEMPVEFVALVLQFSDEISEARMQEAWNTTLGEEDIEQRIQWSMDWLAENSPVEENNNDFEGKKAVAAIIARPHVVPSLYTFMKKVPMAVQPVVKPVASGSNSNATPSGSDKKVSFNDPRLPVASGSGSANKMILPIKAKAARKNVIELGDSSEDEKPALKKVKSLNGNAKWKGKGKAPIEVISLSDSEDDLPQSQFYVKKKAHRPLVARPLPALIPALIPALVPARALAPAPQPAANYEMAAYRFHRGEAKELNAPFKPPTLNTPPVLQPVIATPKVVVPVVVPVVAPVKLPTPPPQTQEDRNLASVLSIIHDVQPQYVLDLLRDPFRGKTVEHVLEILFSTPYPKVEVVGSSKGKERAKESEKVVVEKNWLDIREDGGSVYREATLNQLCIDFDLVPKGIVRKIYATKMFRYSPSYMELQKEIARSEAARGWKSLQGSRSGGKGKEREQLCQELEIEITWLQAKLHKDSSDQNQIAAELKMSEDEIARGEYFECGCCFGDTGFSQCVNCTDGDSFCKECFVANADTQVGLRQYELPCMADGCTAHFAESELAKHLSAKTLAALHKIKQEREIDGAEILGLAKCPFCPFACIIENAQERLFVCQREDCGIVSCRTCEKPDHLPRTCAEMDDDKKIDGLHKIEEAMTESLIRRCPNRSCKNPFIKEDGCNKMVCLSCRTMSCYICSAIVTGYSHFINAGTNATSTDKGAKCELWDDSKKNEFERVEAARAEAAARVAKENPAVGSADLKALALAPPPPPPANIANHIAIHAGIARPAPVVRPPRRRVAAREQAEAHARMIGLAGPHFIPPPVLIPPPLVNHALLQQQQQQNAAQLMADQYMAAGQHVLAARHQAIAARYAQAIILGQQQQHQQQIQQQQQQIQQNQAYAIQQQLNLQQAQQQQQHQQALLQRQQQQQLHQQRMLQVEAQQAVLRERRLVEQKLALAKQRAASKARAKQVEQARAVKKKAEDDREAKRARLVKR